MDRLRALILLPLLFFCSLHTIKAQNATTLQAGAPIERTMAKGESHTFDVDMEENGFAQLVVEQQGIDVLIIVSTPSGQQLRVFDTANGADGPELVSFVAFTAGRYRVAVSPLDPDAKPGRFQIKLIEVRQATDQELKTSKNQAVAKEKGVALLGEMESSISQIKSPVTRIQAQLRVSDLLWDFDEKRAAKYLADAVPDAKEYIASLDPESEEYLEKYSFISQLRYQIVQALAEVDTDGALSFMRATAPRNVTYVDGQAVAALESALELSVANMIMEKDPNRALQIVRQNLKQGYSTSMLNTLTQMAEKNRELASQLAHEIAAKLLGESRLLDTETANVAIGLMKSFLITEPNAQIQTRHMSISLTGGLISEDDYKQLVQKAFSDVIAYKVQGRTPYSTNATRDGIWTLMTGLRSLGPGLDKVVSGGLAALEKKQIEITGRPQVFVNTIQEFQNTITSSPVETALETIQKAPIDNREQLYIQLANREANNGETARARQIINDHVTNPYQRSEALKNIERLEISGAMSKGKLEEALRNISALRNPRERAAQVAQVAQQIAAGQQRANAISFLEQARNLLGTSPQAQDQSQMHALFQIARAFSNYDSKRSFEIMDPLIDQFNEICAAARVLQGFGAEFFEDDELDLQNGNTVGQVAQELSTVLGSLALTNFDRAKASSDKVRLPEIRVQIYLEIATQTIDSTP